MAPTRDTPAMRFDHIILATRELDRAADLWTERGFDVLPGGRHTGIGTMNRIVPLGQGYLELVTVVDAGEAATHPFGRWAADALDRDVALMGWALAVDDVAPIAQRLGTGTDIIARAGLQALTTGIEEASRRPQLPFFIAREPGSADPGSVAADHRRPVDGMAALELGGTLDELEAWTGPGVDLGRIELRFDASRDGLLGASIRSGSDELAVVPSPATS